ncbi:hypothetical protein K440DRAFT_427281 [Wilcoxina mikolae CBS 423.85]|nr:hypothetical protein K440DRAFT_427281 [Wilcoxina mikolae CBS 423.85]
MLKRSGDRGSRTKACVRRCKSRSRNAAQARCGSQPPTKISSGFKCFRHAGFFFFSLPQQKNEEKIIHHHILQPVQLHISCSANRTGFPPSRKQPPQLAIHVRGAWVGRLDCASRRFGPSRRPGPKEKVASVSAGKSYRMSDARTWTVPSLHLSHHAQPSIATNFNPQQCNVACRSITSGTTTITNKQHPTYQT